MASGFKDAVVLHRKAAGHMSVTSVSTCTAKTIRDYFRLGKLPPAPEVECEIESRMFEPQIVSRATPSGEDQELLSVMYELQQGVQMSPMF
jgi:hypothetical protein